MSRMNELFMKKSQSEGDQFLDEEYQYKEYLKSVAEADKKLSDEFFEQLSIEETKTNESGNTK
jgi:hypothetical protein